ncbi:ABC-transporter ATP-binding protein system [Candidatus Phycorickettsia trachydisci]|uniref:ABC-transporter ATP-binding protein system n=1 Tax=Candidatus Phycorickettsia trachydisci TaxID=2115978 RepID=A0A2P1P8R4_9RICK|nr:ABC transporter ATP-binding protein [Candidatus Phycorickettsia trachydisci]AVP87647.1 ABC-transporter ATP-binding protein system [Candidatus Phycorickettsia trachydisci]
MAKYAIDLHNLSKSFAGKRAVDNINIQVPRGKVYGFLGPNGSGKTTTIRMICGLLTPDSGEGTCLDYDIRTQSQLIQENVGYMTQKFSYWEDMTTQENLEFISDMFGINNKKAKVQECIEKFGLEKYQFQLAGRMSGGWKQRLALAACTLHNPELLLLDEPTAGVDPKARREFWDEIHKLAAEGVTILVTTHYMDEAERCHKIIYIAGGKIMTQGTIDEVINNAGLTTWVVKGENLASLQRELEKHPAVTTAAPFGESLHVSGIDEEALNNATAPYRNNPSYSWELSSPSMEDAFIHYMTKAQMENLL